MMLPPPVTPLETIDTTLAAQGFAVLDAAGAGQLLDCASSALDAWLPFWDQIGRAHV